MKQRGYIPLGLIFWGLGIALVVGAIAAIYYKGRHDEALKWEAEAAEAKRVRYELVSALALDLAKAKEDRLIASLQKERELRELRDEYAGKLASFVPRTPSTEQCIRSGFVRYLDAVAGGVPLGPSPEPAVALAPSGVEVDEAAGVIAHNYGLYHQCKTRVSELIAEYDAVADKINVTVHGMR